MYYGEYNEIEKEIKKSKTFVEFINKNKGNL